MTFKKRAWTKQQQLFNSILSCDLWLVYSQVLNCGQFGHPLVHPCPSSDVSWMTCPCCALELASRQELILHLFALSGFRQHKRLARPVECLFLWTSLRCCRVSLLCVHCRECSAVGCLTDGRTNVCLLVCPDNWREIRYILGLASWNI